MSTKLVTFMVKEHRRQSISQINAMNARQIKALSKEIFKCVNYFKITE